MKQMHVSIFRILLFSLLISGFIWPQYTWSQGKASQEKVGGKPAARTPWTTSKVKGTPDPPYRFVTRRAFPHLKFKNCLDMTMEPGSDRIYLAEQSGRIVSFPNDQSVKKVDLVFDTKKHVKGAQSVYAIAFHPKFETNRYIFICYIKGSNQEDGTHVARFKVNATDPPTIDPKSERTIVTWLSGGHNGCCLKFGPDGYLYISTGDGGPANPPDPKKSGQDTTNLLSSILRLDIDRTDDGKGYSIPADNPFVNNKDARDEIWAYGLRNPWRMSFDRETGEMWVGDVGWELLEMLYLVKPGGNYGWAVKEGSQSVNPEWPRGPTPILPPTIEHPHSESSSITDGLTYYGSRLTELKGHHIYADYDTGKIWSFRYEKGKVQDHSEIADTTHRIVSFAEDQHGEMFILDHTAGTLHELIPNPQRNANTDFPLTLSATGLFSSVAKQVPEAGVVDYSINAEPWHDHARSQRWVAVPGKGTISNGSPAYSFPKDSVLVKTLSLEMTQGEPTSTRNIETQILHFDGAEWHPYTYRWNDRQTDATLVSKSGETATFRVADPSAPGGVRVQNWRFSGRAECQRCHNKWSGPPLGFNTAQLNLKRDVGDANAVDQLERLIEVGLVGKLPAKDKRPQLANPYDDAAELNGRARAYLQVNCAHCHRKHAGSAVLSQMHSDLKLEDTLMLNVRPTQGTFNIHSAQVIAPGNPYQSVLLYRVSKLGAGRMPYLGSSEVDMAGIALMHDWIADLPTKDRAASNDAKLIKQLLSGKDDGALANLLSTTSGAMRLASSVERFKDKKRLFNRIVETGAGHAQPAVRDLFEPYVAANKRIKRLGEVVNVRRLLSLKGDVDRGRDVFHKTSGVSCKNCHRIGKEGKQVGPDLSQIAKKNTPAQLLESILQPSKRIDPKYVTHLVETAKGKLFTGLLVKKSEKEVVLQDAKGELVRIRVDDIDRTVPQGKSLMPELLLRDMTEQQVADLLAYLSSLK